MPGPIGLGYEDVAKLSTKADTMKRQLKGLEDTFIKWNAEEEGGWLTQRLGNQLAMFIRNRLREGKAFTSESAPLSDVWKEKKRILGLRSEMGRATDQMLESIKAFPVGKRGGRIVGISSNAMVMRKYATHRTTGKPYRIGKIDKIQNYAKLLEFGYHGSEHRQPPRPWFFPSFWEFVKDELPDEIKNTIARDVQKYVDQIADTAEATAPEFEPEEYYRAIWRG